MPASAPKKSLFVFHVNDSTDDQVLFQMAAKKADVPFAWQVADSAEKAIAYFDSLLKLSETELVAWPDLVVLDIVMPRESGFKVLEYIKGKAKLKRLPVVIFTGQHSQQVRDEAYALGANSFMLKPQDMAQTVDLVSSLYQAWSGAQRPTL